MTGLESKYENCAKWVQTLSIIVVHLKNNIFETEEKIKVRLQSLVGFIDIQHNLMK